MTRPDLTGQLKKKYTVYIKTLSCYLPIFVKIHSRLAKRNSFLLYFHIVLVPKQQKV